MQSARAHVWYASPEALSDPSIATHARSLLSENERLRAVRFVFERDHLTYVAAHALCRIALSAHQDVAPSAWRFVAGDNGRPEIVAPSSPLRFNLSHTRGLVTCAVVDTIDIGVDVESLDRGAPLEIAERYLAPAELRALRELPTSEQPRRFFQYWTLKESYLKARGLGLSIPLDRITMILTNEDTATVQLDPDVGNDSEEWQFAQREPSPSHALAVCLHKARREERYSVIWHAASNDDFCASITRHARQFR
ncbi:MAG: 4'-phosphopantetheinyl transferase superfamily protein [Kofleriaceae bacterium]